MYDTERKVDHTCKNLTITAQGMKKMSVVERSLLQRSSTVLYGGSSTVLYGRVNPELSVILTEFNYYFTSYLTTAIPNFELGIVVEILRHCFLPLNLSLINPHNLII